MTFENSDLGEGGYLVFIVDLLINEVPDEDEVIDVGVGSMRIDVIEE